jgi:hypothetical protein
MQLMTQQPTATTLAQQPMPQIDADRRQEMQQAWKAYRGKLPNPLKVGKDERDHNVKPNRCRTIVDKGASFLSGQPLKIQPEQQSKQDFIDGLWGDDDDKMTLLTKISMNGGVCGQMFVKVIPPKNGMKYPRLVNLNPQIVRIVTDPEDCDTHLAYVIEYPSNNEWQKKQIIARVDPDNSVELWGNNDPLDTWTITNYQRKGQTGTWIQRGEPEDWLYPFPPIFTNQNLPNPNEDWGISDLTDDLIAMNKAINFMASNIAKIIYYHAHPKLWAKGTRGSQVQTAIEDILCFEAPDAQLAQLMPMDNFDGLLKVLADLRSDMDEQSRVPAVALGRITEMIRGTISGVALELMFQPLLEKTTQKRRLYGKLIRQVSRAALVICDQISVEQYEDYKIELIWPPLLPNDELQAAQEAVILQGLDVSMRTIYARLGLDYDSEVEQKMEEMAKQVVAASRGQGFPPPNPMMQQSPQPPTDQQAQEQNQQQGAQQ